MSITATTEATRPAIAPQPSDDSGQLGETGLVDQLARAIYMTHWKPADPDSGRDGAPVWENASNNVRQWVTAQAAAVIAVIPRAGYAIVPVEPTPAMVVDGRASAVPVYENEPAVRECWRAMLTAYAAERR